MVDEATIICDLSGSMMECGKRFIMQTAIRTIDQYYQLLNPSGAELKLVGWKSGLEELSWSSGEQPPDTLMDCSGSANVSALVTELGDYLDAPVIILTDGYWDDPDDQFAHWADGIDDNYVRVIMLGADASNKLGRGYVFTAEALLAALEGFGD